MSNSISRAPYPSQGFCGVCGRWAELELWDEGLNSRFCTDCFDYVVDAEEALASQGFSHQIAGSRGRNEP
jgi:hypothetical protein